MISEQQQELASLYAVGALTASESKALEEEMAANPELMELVHALQSVARLMAEAAADDSLPQDLKGKMLRRIDKLDEQISAVRVPGLRFMAAASQSGWKQLPIPGASVKLLSLEREQGYAVLLGKLEPGARYPAHGHSKPENFYILTGDLIVGKHKLAAGDFHHADAGSEHEESYSIEGCTLIAALSLDDPLVAFAMA